MLGRWVWVWVWPQGPCEVAGCGHWGGEEGWRLGEVQCGSEGGSPAWDGQCLPHRHKCARDSTRAHPQECQTLGA